MQKLIDSIKILNTLWIYITTYMGACLEVNVQKKFEGTKMRFFPDVSLDTVLIRGMINQIIILICSFLDEWNQHLNSKNIPEYSKDISDLKNYLKPVFSRINKWTGLKEYRNTILAHNLRNKGIPILNEDLISLNIPITPEEILGITQLLNIVMFEVMDKFSNIISYDDFAGLTSNIPEIKIKQNGSKVEIEEILSELIRLKNMK